MQRVAKIYLKEVATLRGKKKKKFCKEKRYYILSFDQSLTPNHFFFLIRKKTLVPLLFPEARG